MADPDRLQRMERPLEPGRALSLPVELEPSLIRSIPAVPVVYEAGAPGLLKTLHKTGSAHYTGGDITIPETLARMAAAARQNAFGKNGP